MFQKNTSLNLKHSILIFSLLLCAYGCNGGGGGSSSISSAIDGFAGGSGENTEGSVGSLENGNSGSSESGGDSDAAIATIHNPEPATMLLLGSGLAALRFYRNKYKFKKNII